MVTTVTVQLSSCCWNCSTVAIYLTLPSTNPYQDPSYRRPMAPSQAASTSKGNSLRHLLLLLLCAPPHASTAPPSVVAAARCSVHLCPCSLRHLLLLLPLLLAAFNALAASFVLEMAAPYCHHVEPVQDDADAPARLWFHNHQSSSRSMWCICELWLVWQARGQARGLAGVNVQINHEHGPHLRPDPRTQLLRGGGCVIVPGEDDIGDRLNGAEVLRRSVAAAERPHGQHEEGGHTLAGVQQQHREDAVVNGTSHPPTCPPCWLVSASARPGAGTTSSVEESFFELRLNWGTSSSQQTRSSSDLNTKFRSNTFLEQSSNGGRRIGGEAGGTDRGPRGGVTLEAARTRAGQALECLMHVCIVAPTSRSSSCCLCLHSNTWVSTPRRRWTGQSWSHPQRPDGLAGGPASPEDAGVGEGCWPATSVHPAAGDASAAPLPPWGQRSKLFHRPELGFVGELRIDGYSAWKRERRMSWCRGGAQQCEGSPEQAGDGGGAKGIERRRTDGEL